MTFGIKIPEEMLRPACLLPSTDITPASMGFVSLPGYA
jgi:hypothetical protein